MSPRPDRSKPTAVPAGGPRRNGRALGLATPASDGGAPSQSPLEWALAVLRRRWTIVAVCTLALPVAALVFSLSQEKLYQASASLLFRDPGFSQQLSGAGFVPSAEDPERTAATNLKLVSVNEVADRTAEAIDRPGITGGYVAEHVTISEQGQSYIVDVLVEDTDPALAAEIANTFGEQYIAFRKDADRSRVQEAQELLQAQIDDLGPDELASAEGRQLQDRAQDLKVLASLQTGNAELVQQAREPTSPTSPSTKRNVAVGLFLGLLLGMTLAFVREQLDRRLRSVDDLKRITKLPILASVPHSASMSARRPGRTRMSQASSDEAFRMLRANLRYFNVDRRLTSLLTTSAASRDGKTTVSWNLAIAEAQSGKRVLLIEGDLRRPTLAQSIGVSPHGGVSLLLTGTGTLEDNTMAVADMPMEWPETAPQLDVLFAGPPPPNPAELIESQRMESLLAEAERGYDLVIVDSPPTAVVADAVPLTRLVSGVIVVTRLGQSTSDGILALLDQLEQLDAPVLGIVVNDTSVPESSYYHQQRQPL